MNQYKKLIWTVTDGSQGMISQVKGLAQQLSSNIKEIKVDLIFPWSKFQPGILPIYKWIFKNKIDDRKKPNIVISCGRKSIYFSLFLKKMYKKDIVTIHIQNPKIKPENFDFVIAPNHDLYNGNNVIKTCGALHQFTKANINKQKDLTKIVNKNNLVSFIIGGPNQHYYFSDKIVKEIINNIKSLKQKYTKHSFCIIPSRRTSKISIKLLKKELKNLVPILDKNDRNPYLFSLKFSKYFVVTSDSTSMVSECAFTGKPVYVYHLPFKRISNRISNFHKEFEDLEITRKFDGSLNDWEYKYLNEAERIAGILKPRILNI